ncbi:MAG: thioredoxin domain-containing protein, partial [Syntrophales bacterium LBB04]|nr:thioredoxin domain-containing protein [Syntrophales bacterium LBB04]
GARGGGFCRGEDADSEGVEGRFYLWRMEEVRRLLDPEEVRLATAAFSLTEEGNFVDPVESERRGDNILHLSGSPAKIAKELGMTGATYLQRLETVRLRLLATREKRVRPQRDDKILTDWNGLMIAALARAARVLNEPRYLEVAREAIAFILAQMKTPDGRLLHRFCKGEAAVTANLDDYAFLIWGLIDTYEAGFNTDNLRAAITLQGIVNQHFRDPDGGFFSTPDDGEALLFRPKEGHDGAVPSGNAVTLMNLIRLGRMTGDPRREEEAAESSRAFAESLQQTPTAHAQWMIALELLAGPSREVVIAGRSGREDTNAMLAILRQAYLPNLTLLFRPEEEE